MSTLPVLQTTLQQVTAVTTQLLGLAVLAGTLAAVVALSYRWAAREQMPLGLALLVGLSGVAVYLNTTTALGQAISGNTAATADVEVALFNIGAFLTGGAGAWAGQRAGDRFGTDVLVETGDIDEEVDRLVRTVGRVLTVQIPDDVGDVTGYDPVPAATKEKLAGKKLVFPRKLTVDELHDRLVSRLKTDYGVSAVDLDLADDGTVNYLAVGSRAAGIGPTLPPSTNAVAIRADPAFSASAGDVVQVWDTDPMRRVLTAELRAVAGDVVTIAIDTADTPKIDPRRQYHLVTLPVEDRPEREFASLLRAAEETFSTVTVEAGSPLHGMPVGALDLAVVAVRPDAEGAAPIALPDGEQILAPGDVVFAISRPDALRRLEAAGGALDPSLASTVGTPESGSFPDDSTAQPPSPDGPAEPDSHEGIEGGESAASGSPLDTDGIGERPAAEGETTVEDERVAGKADASTVDDLKDEFDSEEADWDEDDADIAFDDDEVGSDDELDSETDGPDGDTGNGAATDAAGGQDPSETATDDSLGPFEEDDELEPVDLEEDSDGESLEFGDDVLGLELEADDETLSLDEEDELAENDDGEETGDDDAADDDEEDSDGSKSFAQLKDEFESGDADWEDDISDSPGGDMRLDE